MLTYFIHKLRCFVALNDINSDNGATIYYDKSNNSKVLKKYHLNLFLKAFDFRIDDKDSHYINETELNRLSQECKVILKLQKGRSRSY